MRGHLRAGDDCDWTSLDRNCFVYRHSLALENLVDLYLWANERDGTLGWNRRVPNSIHPNGSRRSQPIEHRPCYYRIMPSRKTKQGSNLAEADFLA